MEQLEPPLGENPLNYYLNSPNRDHDAWVHFVRTLAERRDAVVPYLSSAAVAMASEFAPYDTDISSEEVSV